MQLCDVRRVDFGWFVRPGSESPDGQPRLEPVLGYAVAHPDGWLLFDTGMGRGADVDAQYRPARRPLPDALAAAGLHVDDVRHVANCHLHVDHCGGNPDLAGRPVYVQRAELDAARSTDGYTQPELVDDPRLTHVELDGEAEVLPGLLVLPTPGHVDGHQSLVVRCDDGTVVLAGQSHEHASALSTELLVRRAAADRPDGDAPGLPGPAWLDRLLELDPRRVLFAHDEAVWEPPRR